MGFYWGRISDICYTPCQLQIIYNGRNRLKIDELLNYGDEENLKNQQVVVDFYASYAPIKNVLGG